MVAFSCLPGHPRRVWLHCHVLLGCPHVVGVVEDPESPCLDAQALLCGDHWVPQCHAGGFQLVIHVLQPCCHDGDSVHQLLVHCWESSSQWWLSRPCAVAGTDCPRQPYHPRSVWLCSLVLLGHLRTVWLGSLVLPGCPHVVGVPPLEASNCCSMCSNLAVIMVTWSINCWFIAGNSLLDGG